MAHLYVICGHGNGDSGACGHGYQEQERVRALGKLIKQLGGDDVTLHSTSDNAYASGAINRLMIPKDWQIVELHMDSDGTGTARGAHVIICNQFEPDAYDTALANELATIFPGRSNKLVKRGDLANPNRAASKGLPYRLVENGFISNAKDVEIFNSRLKDIALAYLRVFGISEGQAATETPAAQPATPSVEGSLTDLAKRVIAGEFGNGDARKAALGDKYDAVQAEVNRILGVSTTASKPASSNIDDLARRVIAGEFGNGEARKKALGSNYDAVQARVNEMLGAKGSSAPSYDVDAIARQVIRGDWGNGETRRQKLTAAGYDYATIQARVNELC